MVLLRRIVLLLALWLAFEAVISLFATCGEGTYQPRNAASAQQVKENCTAFSGPVLASSWAFLYWLGHVLEGYGEAVIAVFTIVLAFATGLLWKATRDLVHGADATAQRQLRAYVAIGGADIRLLRADTIHANVTLKNFGQTPGYDLTTWTLIRVGAPDAIPYDETSTPKQRSIIGPTADFNAPSDILTISQRDFGDIQTGKKVIFVWGQASYVDTFNKKWTFIFRGRNSEMMITPQSTGGQVHWTGWGLSPHPKYGYTEREG
jgi:hypothetical protein